MPTPQPESPQSPAAPQAGDAGAAPDHRLLILVSWLWVGVPLAYGIYELVQKAAQLFTD